MIYMLIIFNQGQGEVGEGRSEGLVPEALLMCDPQAACSGEPAGAFSPESRGAEGSLCPRSVSQA